MYRTQLVRGIFRNMKIVWLLILFTAYTPTEKVFAEEVPCSDVLHNQGDHDPSLKPNDLKPRGQLWRKLNDALSNKVEGVSHPLESAGVNADQIGKAILKMTAAMPELAEALKKNHQLEQGRPITVSEYNEFMRPITRKLIQVAKNSKDSLEIFAALETLKNIAQVESYVPFPKTQEEIKKEAEIEKKEKEKKEKKEKKDQPEEDPEWNEAQKKYDPENKDISQDDSDGAKKKNVDLVWVNTPPTKGLLRQRIYDHFDYKDWKSIPASRAKVKRAATAQYRMGIDTLKGNHVDIPMPYGMTLKPGNYTGYEIEEVGPGEFKLNVTQPGKHEFDMYAIQSERNLPSAPAGPDRFYSYFPEHLRIFADSLKGLRPLDAAAKLEAYMSKDGGFFYYSKGDKIDEAGLKAITEKYQSFIAAGLPKPVAMANANAFNCDGAAWIGGLILRDWLNIPTRVIGGRTSGGFKTINNQKWHVVKSSSDAHAWLEVYDGANWVPFDMTPKTNVPDREMSPDDTQQEIDPDAPPPEKSDDGDPQEGEPQKGDKSDSKDEKPGEDKEAKDGKEDKDAKEDKDGEKKEGEKGEKADGKSKAESKDFEVAKKLEDLIKARSTAGASSSAKDFNGMLILQSELLFVEALVHEGSQTKSLQQIAPLLGFMQGTVWAPSAEATYRKLDKLLNEAKYNRYNGLEKLLIEVKTDFSQNKAMDAKSKLDFVKGMLESLISHRDLTAAEVKALESIQKISRLLQTIKHENSHEHELVLNLMKKFPGGISKKWLKDTYGEDIEQLGSGSASKLATDLVKTGKLLPLLREQAMAPYVDMTLNSSIEPQWKDEPTLTKSLVPKPRQDLVVTRNPLDFMKMLWNLRPGEPMFAPTFQGRQFAVASLETRRVVNPKNPIERKITVIYEDVSPSMDAGDRLPTAEATAMAFIDRALSEVDPIGRPIHEVYLMDFHDRVMPGVHISSKEDALAYFANKMAYKKTASGSGTDIQATLMHFYDLVGNAHKANSATKEGRFQKANMVLLTDGGSTVNQQEVLEARKKIPADVQVNLNVVSIGNEENEDIKALCQMEGLSTGKPRYQVLSDAFMAENMNPKLKFNPEAFATNKAITGQMLSEINELLKAVWVDPRLPADAVAASQQMSKLGLSRTDPTKFQGSTLRVSGHLSKFRLDLIDTTDFPKEYKRRWFQAILQNYPRFTGRNFQDLLISERDNLEALYRSSF